MSERIVTVFGGSATSPETTLWREAEELGRLLAQRGYAVCNGGFGGTMAAVSAGAKSEGGRTIGVVTKFLDVDQPNRWIDEAISVPTYLDRVMKLIDMGDAYIVLEGSVGTFSEFFLVWCLEYIGKIPRKPIILIGQRWLNSIEALKANMMLTPAHMNLLRFANTATEAVEILSAELSD